MLRTCLVLLGLAVLVAADLEVKPIQEDTSVPGVASSTYAIVQDGRVVGVVEHYRSEGGLGRRFGPPSDHDSPVAELLAQLWASQADALAGLRDRLLAAPSRCPIARQMALARMQAAAAAAAAAAAQPHAPRLLQRPALPSFTKPMFGPGTLLLDSARADPRAAAAEPVRRLPADGAAGDAAAAYHGPEQPEAATFQDVANHPEDFADLPTVQEQLFGPELAEEGESVPGYNPEVDALPAIEPARWMEMDAAAKEVAAAEPARWMEMDAAAKEVDAAEPGRWMEMDAAAKEVDAAEPGRWMEMDAAAKEVDAAEPARWMEMDAEAKDEEPAGVLPALAMLWARFAREPMPRGPAAFEEQPPFGGRPQPMPLLGRPHPHHGMMHDMAHDMPHGHGWVHRPGPVHGEPTVRRPSLLGPGPMPRMVGGQVLVQRRDGRWVPLTDTVPAGPPGEMPRWRLWGTDGSFNWGLATFIALAVACAAVWGAMLVQWAAYCRARANHDAAAYFITRVSGSDEAAALKPLLHEGPVKGGAVEHASAHVAGAQSAKVLSYELLKGSDDGEH